MRHYLMRHHFMRHHLMLRCLAILHDRSASTSAVIVALLLLTLVSGGLFVAQPAVAQVPRVANLAYGQTVPGELTKPGGIEHYFTGCANETVGISVTANDFAPRIELFAPEDAGQDEAIASAVAAANEKTATFDGVQLPVSGPYTILINGRTRGARGGYSVTLEGGGPDTPLSDDGPSKINLTYGETVTDTLGADEEKQWNFRACTGDEISAKVEAEGFDPNLRIFFPIAELPLATAVAEEGEQSVELRWTATVNGLYNMYLIATNGEDTGDFTLDFALEGQAEIVPIGSETPEASETPEDKMTVISELSPTPTSTPTPASTPTPTAATGPRGGHGNPTPRPGKTLTPAATPTATVGATPTPEYEMPGFGDSAFTLFDVSQGGPVNAVAYSPDGLQFATAGVDGTVRVWNAISGKLIQSLEGHTSQVNEVAFSPDNAWLASAGDDGTVRVWDENGDEIATLEMPSDYVLSVAFSPDSAEVLATTAEGDAIVWDVATESKRLTLEGHEGPVFDGIYNSEGSQFVTGDAAGVARLWNAQDGTMVDSLPINAGPGSADPILSLAFSNDGSSIVAGGVRGVNDASVQIWDIASGDIVADLGNHGEWGSIATITPDDAYVITAQVSDPDTDGPVVSNAYIWNSKTGKLAVALVGFPAGIKSLAMSPDGFTLLLTDGSTVYSWQMAMTDVFVASYGDPVGVQVPAEAKPTATPTRTPRPSATPTPAQANTPTAEPTETPAETPTEESFTPPVELDIFCMVTSAHLNMRPGPGTEYNPPVTVLAEGDLLIVNGRNEDASWLLADLVDANLEPVASGWVSTTYLFCLGDVNDAPVVEGD